MNTKDKYLGEFEQFLLLSILSLGKDAYGTTIRQHLADEIARDVTIGALYTTLERLEKKGLIDSKMGEVTRERGGRAKKYFTVSTLGQTALQRSKKALSTLWENVMLAQGGAN